MNRLFTYIIYLLAFCSSGLLVLSCNTWDLPTKKSLRDCGQPPTGTLNAQAQQLRVEFSVTNTSGTIDQITWDFGNGNTTVTTGMTTTYTYPAAGVYNVTAKLTNTCGSIVSLSRQITTQADVATQDLIASVSFTDRSLQDVSGYNNHVKLVDNATFTTDRNGRANSAILLDGSGDYFYMDDNSSLNPEALTISVWIKPAVMNGRMQIYNKARFSDGMPQTYSSLMKLQGDIGPKITFMTDIKQGSNCVGGEGWQGLEFTSPVNLNTWYHLVYTYSGRSARMYLNNILLASTDNLPASAMDKCPGGELKFGAQYQSLPWYFNGAMDDIRIYKRAITAAEVETLFKQ